MVTIKYSGRTLIPEMQPDTTITVHSHNFKMPGNFTITTHKDYQKLIDEPKKVTYYQDGVFVESVEQYKNIEITVKTNLTS